MRTAIRLFAFVLVFATTVCAQSPNATVNGQVLDTSGGLIADATVEVINEATNVSSSTKTNSSGIYLVPDLPPATYRIQVSHLGFKTIVKPDVILNVRDAVEINFTLPIGAISETVTVEAGAPLINTQDAAVSTVVDRQFAENLPLNGRSFQSLIQLTPGVVLTVTNQSDLGQFSVNGQRAASNYWMVDGVSANIGISVNASGTPGNGLGGSLGSFSTLGGTNSLVSVDALQEFRIQTSTYAPEFGRTPGGQISIVTRSGTSQFHGTAFDYFRNDVLDANDWFADHAGLPKPEERQNDFGGTLSGPILKDRMFFFFSYEGLRLRLPQTTLTTVPCDSTCQVFGNARAMAAPAMQPFLNAYPLPNGPEVFQTCTPNVNGCPASGKQPTGSAQLNASYSNPAMLDAYSIRIDRKLKNGLSLFGRFNYSPSENEARGGTFTGDVLSTVFSNRITTQTVTAGGTWAISPTIADDLRFNYSRTNASGDYRLDSFAGAVPLASLPFPSPFTPQNAVFTFRILPLEQGILAAGHLEQNLQRQINVVDTLTKQKGLHTLKFGIDYRRLTPRIALPAYDQGVFFLNVSSAEKGNILESAIGSGLTPTLLFRNLGTYAQDTWHVLPRITLTYGLRWDVDFVPQSLEGPIFPAVTGFNLNDLSNLALAPAGTPPYRTTYGNFAPRLGAAFQLSQSHNWQTVMRGGFGVFYDLVSSEAGNAISLESYPFGTTPFTFGGTFPLSPASAAPSPITPANLADPNGTGLLAFDPKLKLPYTLEWNIALEQSLGSRQTISASYIGAAGRRLLQSALVYLPNPNFAQAQLLSNTATSDYDALQVQFQRRLSYGLQALASYTWSHSIDDGSAGSLFTNAFAPSAVAGSNRGPSDFDIRNTFSAAVTYEVPTPKFIAFANVLARGWSLQNIVEARSAPPVDISDANLLFDTSFSAIVRPDLVPGEPLYLSGAQYPGGKALNPAAFTDPPFDPNTFTPLRQGTTPRNFLRGFGATQWDLAIHRDFHIHETMTLQFRAEMFNVLNHPNFGQPNGQFGTSGFGLSNQMLGQNLSGYGSSGAGAFNPLYQFGGPRSIQLALKAIF